MKCSETPDWEERRRVMNKVENFLHGDPCGLAEDQLDLMDEKRKIQEELNVCFYDLSLRLDEKGKALLEKYTACYEELVQLEQSEFCNKGISLGRLWDLEKNTKETPPSRMKAVRRKLTGRNLNMY